MLKPLLLRLILAVAGVVLALACVEAVLRMMPQRPPLTSGALDIPHTAGYHQPDFRNRRYGLRRPSRQGENDPRFRILVVGDSFTWGSRVWEQDAYPDRIGTRLAKWHGRDRFQVINFSRPGWNTARELDALGSWISRIRPDALVLGYCLNDAEPVSHEVLRRLSWGTDLRRPDPGVSRWLYRRSRVYHLLYDKLENLRRRRALVAFYHAIYENEPGWKRTREALAGFRDLATRHDIPFLLVVFPIFDSQLDWRYKYDDLHRRMRETAQELDIDLLDLLPRYRGVDARRLAAEPFVDGHPSELAHRIAADAILDWWIQRGVLPPPP